MLIIIENGKIKAVEKKFLTQNNIGLEELSGLINTLEMQISSLRENQMEINSVLYNVKKIDTVSITDIQIFDLQTAENESLIKHEFEMPEPPEENILKIEEPETEDLPSLQNNKSAINEDLISEEISPLEKDEFKTEQNEEQKLNHENNFDNIDLISIQEPVKKESDEKPFEINLIKEEKEKKIQEEPATPADKTIQIEEDKIEFETPPYIKETENKDETSLSVNDISDGTIEISFEDDLAEIYKILSLCKKEFKKTITDEINKASEELMIDFKDLSDWYEQLIGQIKNDKKEIYKAINKKDYDALHENYHKLKGAALNLRLSNIALILKKLDELSKNHEDINKIKDITDNFYTLIENQSDFKPDISKNEHSDSKEIEEIVLKTIKSYLSTQNEAQFQKDKKYIEKLLNTKIDSLNDLEKILKGK